MNLQSPDWNPINGLVVGIGLAGATVALVWHDLGYALSELPSFFTNFFLLLVLRYVGALCVAILAGDLLVAILEVPHARRVTWVVRVVLWLVVTHLLFEFGSLESMAYDVLRFFGVLDSFSRWRNG